ncbi:TPA: helix-turn-helix transcriptional regulator [Haemophilus influenzae]|uniref:helix-turn-helix domain-containing protein n=1 Tax=Haemophilus influenzae TaxID=727 RepID=UPI000A0DD548|nr:helix-turn-helix transcriptional regulator [Haemophilus influenzae]MCK8838906.1 helix-turn-helix transcriptional regulator [Haemophilus influenzae]MCK9089484.1 helix-turn-helix transcriptional regulator [Haemophilus influenzae]ORJ43159.1 transcriptional regulator [Haemophilus influenzae]PRJ49801.1 DNA-binding transcriptional repressor PuuR [Haemophilus influenzae]PRK08301.1 DNA-binding transcriptional repressor PuuR [Haemophilus influenzae]
MNKISPLGSNWNESEQQIFNEEEIRESNLRVALIKELITSRQQLGISQKQLETLSGVKQPMIARIEKGQTNPQLETLLKLLAPLGKTLSIVPLRVKNA